MVILHSFICTPVSYYLKLIGRKLTGFQTDKKHVQTMIEWFTKTFLFHNSLIDSFIHDIYLIFFIFNNTRLQNYELFSVTNRMYFLSRGIKLSNIIEALKTKSIGYDFI